jgi:hypothetical protein
MSFDFKETAIVLGMLARGDKQHDIAAYFGVNGGRVAEVATGKGDWPSAIAAPMNKLPPPGPYVGAKTAFEIKTAIDEAISLISSAGDKSDESALAIEALNSVAKKLT